MTTSAEYEALARRVAELERLVTAQGAAILTLTGQVEAIGKGLADYALSVVSASKVQA